MTDDRGRNQIREMAEKIDAIDRLCRELNDVGKGLPVIEKNVIGIQSYTHALRFGISDLADVG